MNEISALVRKDSGKLIVLSHSRSLSSFLSLSLPMRTQQENNHLRTRKWALTRHQTYWHFDLGLLKKEISFVYNPSSLRNFVTAT